MAATTITAVDLLQKDRPESESALSYTDKQVDIIRAAINNPDMTPNDLSDHVTASDDFVDASPTYVRNVLERATRAEMTDEDIFDEMGADEDDVPEAGEVSPPEDENEGEEEIEADLSEAESEGEGFTLLEKEVQATVKVVVKREDIEDALDDAFTLTAE